MAWPLRKRGVLDKEGASMSVDVMILPGRQFVPAPSLFFEQLGLENDSPAAMLLGEAPALSKLGSGKTVARDGILEWGDTYVFNLAADNTLALTIGLSTDFDAKEYVEDYGRNLEPEEREAIIKAWKHAGPGLTISSGGGRAVGEIELLAALVRRGARALSGWICIESGAFVYPRTGIYTPAQLDGIQFRLRNSQP
jgi:hypothetical protein